MFHYRSVSHIKVCFFLFETWHLRYTQCSLANDWRITRSFSWSNKMFYIYHFHIHTNRVILADQCCWDTFRTVWTEITQHFSKSFVNTHKKKVLLYYLPGWQASQQTFCPSCFHVMQPMVLCPGRHKQTCMSRETPSAQRITAILLSASQPQDRCEVIRIQENIPGT